MLPFYNHILQQLLPLENEKKLSDNNLEPNATAPGVMFDRSLLILARGLGLSFIISTFIQASSHHQCLVFLLNASSQDEEQIAFQNRHYHNCFSSSMMTEPDNIKSSPQFFKSVKSEISSSERVNIYKEGGVISISSRMLVVDLLLERIPLWIITGFIIFHAESITETSLESFILYIYRKGNSDGFIRAFSDSPESFVSGFNRFSKCMNFLQVENVLLYPRFHLTIQDSLKNSSIEVIETKVSLSPKMARVQIAIFSLLENCLNEIIKCNPGVELQVEGLRVEQSLFRSFDDNLKSQLDPIWHLVGPKTKQLMYDIKLLRKLLNYLVIYDAIAFYRFIESLMIAQKTLSEPSLWLMTDAADTIVNTARDRVFNKKDELEVEENPKWICLQETLKAIFVQNLNETVSGPVLIMVQEESAVASLTEYLATGHQQMIRRLFRNYQVWKNNILKNKSTIMTSIEKNKFALKRKGPEHIRKLIAKSVEKPTAPSEIDEISESKVKSAVTESLLNDIEINEEISRVDDENFDSFFSEAFSDMTEQSLLTVADFSMLVPPYVLMRTYSSMDGLDLLNQYKPKHVILFDADLSFIRTLEVYSALDMKANSLYSFDHSAEKKISSPSLHIHFLMFKESVEEQKYLLLIRKEKEAFEKLIKEKASFIVTNAYKPKDQMVTNVDDFSEKQPLKIDKSLVLVDMREFRSALPFILYKQNFKICPLTLEVGDYVLSPKICVERKSVSDLVSSFANGRLFSQVTSMAAHYRIPVLLIEFDPQKSFVLQAVDTYSTDVTFGDLSSKLCLLLITFPRLRLLWSSSQKATCDLFQDLQKDEDPPSIEEAAVKGNSNEAPLDIQYHLIPKALLTNVPDIVVSDHAGIMSHFKSMKELMNSSKDNLCQVLGENEGIKVYNFFNSSMST